MSNIHKKSVEFCAIRRITTFFRFPIAIYKIL
nr:MAG TPA: hypothetical protein [Inoviridae sp.]